MKKIHQFSEKFCDEIISSLKDFEKIVLQYKNDPIISDRPVKFEKNQPTNADAWLVKNSTHATEIENILKRNIPSIKKLKMVVQRLDINKKSEPHLDSYDYTSVLLLNDSFTDGNLVINGIELNLKKGELIFFNSNDLHYVDKLSSGERYTLVTFITTQEIVEKTNKSII